MLPEAGAEGRRPDSRRRAFAGRCETRRTLRRRLLPGAGGYPQAQRTVRDDDVGSRETRPRPEEDRTVMHGTSTRRGIEGARGDRNIASSDRTASLPCRRPDARAGKTARRGDREDIERT